MADPFITELFFFSSGKDDLNCQIEHTDGFGETCRSMEWMTDRRPPSAVTCRALPAFQKPSPCRGRENPTPRAARFIHHSKKHATPSLALFEKLRSRAPANPFLSHRNRTQKSRSPPRRAAMAPASLMLSLPRAPVAPLPPPASPGTSVVAACSHLAAPSRRRGPGIALAAAPAGRQGGRWRAGVSSFSFLPSFFTGNNKGQKDAEKAMRLKEELLAAIAPLDRGAEATPEDKERVEQVRTWTSYTLCFLSS